MNSTRYIDELGIFPFPFEEKVWYEDEGMRVSLELSEVAFIHFDYKKMTKSKYKFSQELFDEIEEELEEMGYPCVFALIPSELPISHKIEKMFGFKLLEEQPPVKLFVKDLGE